jgi:pyrroline-5-carboxylate reductase
MDAREPDVVGIVGAGRLGQAMARTALRAGRRVIIANSRGPDSLTDVVSELGDPTNDLRERPRRGRHPASSSRRSSRVLAS